MTRWRFGAVLALALAGPAGPALAQASDVVCNKCVGTTDIDIGAVTTGRLSDNAVSAAKLRNLAVTAAKLQNGAVTAAKLQDGAVTAAKLGADVTALGLSGMSVIHAAAFRPDRGSPELYFNGITIGYIRPWQTTDEPCFLAPVFLPDGVTVIEVEAVVLDNSDTGEVDFSLRRQGAGPPTTMAAAATTGTDTAIQTITDDTISSAEVDLLSFAYYATMCMGPSPGSTNNQRFYLLRIFYQ